MNHLPPACPALVIEPKTQACILTRNWPGDLWVHGTPLNQMLFHTTQGYICSLQHPLLPRCGLQDSSLQPLEEESQRWVSVTSLISSFPLHPQWLSLIHFCAAISLAGLLFLSLPCRQDGKEKVVATAKGGGYYNFFFFLLLSTWY